MNDQRLSDAQCVMLIGMIKRMLKAWDYYQGQPAPEIAEHILSDEEMLWEIRDCIEKMEEADFYQPCLPLSIAIDGLRKSEGKP